MEDLPSESIDTESDVPPTTESSRNVEKDGKTMQSPTQLSSTEILLDAIEKHISDQLSNAPENPINEDHAAFLNSALSLVRDDLHGTFNNNYLFEIVCQYHSTTSNKSEIDKLSGDNFSIPTGLNISLCILSKLLGTKFRYFSEAITSRVEEFKLKHINQIENLPSAEEMVCSLFPLCMQLLMTSWMDPNMEVNNDSSIKDHTYSPSPKKQKSDSANLSASKNNDAGSDQTNTCIYPFIQLILEFANNVLISGVAHVLYSRLLHSK